MRGTLRPSVIQISASTIDKKKDLDWLETSIISLTSCQISNLLGLSSGSSWSLAIRARPPEPGRRLTDLASSRRAHTDNTGVDRCSQI